MKARVLVLHGPNLNALGSREPDVYGSTTLAQIDAALRHLAEDLSLDLTIEQHQGEGELISAIHRAAAENRAIVINPGAYTHYSYALRDAIAATKLRVVEVHLSDITRREPWRRVSVLEEVCAHRVLGKGTAGYLEALEWLTAQP